jgi:acetyl-CoA carboxylase carboxyl transferase subunit beta
LTVEQRLFLVVDRGSFVEHDANLSPSDPLEFTDRRTYPDRNADAQAKTGRLEAVVGGVATK